jgi:hypothetical protein
LERLSQKSLPASLFQREERLFTGIRGFIMPFPALKKGDSGGFDGFSKG